MKKFFFTLFILIILGGAVFFFGWAQFTVPPGSYGIINSKTHGVDPLPVRSGEFRWLWYKLIPTNVQIAVFRLEPVKFSVNFNSSLPSGNSYAAFAGMGAITSAGVSNQRGGQEQGSHSDFSWEINAVISFSLDPDSLVQLAARYNIMDQEALDSWMQDTAKNIEIHILRTLSSSEMDSSRLEKILSGGPDPEMEQEIARLYPEIRGFSFIIQSARFPDFILYRQVRLLYEEFLSKQREIVTGAFGKRAESHIAAQLHFDELERYGELLTKYPVLLEYLTLEKNGRAEQ